MGLMEKEVTGTRLDVYFPLEWKTFVNEQSLTYRLEVA